MFPHVYCDHERIFDYFGDLYNKVLSVLAERIVVVNRLLFFKFFPLDPPLKVKPSVKLIKGILGLICS